MRTLETVTNRITLGVLGRQDRWGLQPDGQEPFIVTPNRTDEDAAFDRLFDLGLRPRHVGRGAWGNPEGSPYFSIDLPAEVATDGDAVDVLNALGFDAGLE